MREKRPGRSTAFFPVSFAVPSEVAVGEHLHLKTSLCQPDAFSALTNWTEHSERGEIKLRRCANMPCGADS